MKLPRRRFLQVAFLQVVGAAAAGAGLSRHARALDYPVKPIRWIIGYPAGGSADTVSRILAQWLTERLGQPVIIENKPGAATNISLQAAINSPPDGYTMVYLGTSAHLAGELFQAMTGTKLVHVPYRGEAFALSDMISGQVEVMVDTLSAALPHIRSGALRALGVTSKTRYEALPDVPTVDETVAGYEAISWGGIGVPRGTPAEMVERLNREINSGLADPAARKRFDDLAGRPLLYTPPEFGAFMAAETEKWAEVVKRSGVKAE